MGELVDQCTPSQKMAGKVSMAISSIVVILTFWWGAHSNTNYTGWLGGFNDCTIHAVLMVLGMCFCYSQALLSFRLLDHYLGHAFAKSLHLFWHTSTLILTSTALYFIIQWHNSTKDGLGHLASMHSWLGLGLVIIYSQNWCLGLLSFFLPGIVTPEWKQKYLPSHRFLGIFGLLLASMVMETGIAQKNWIDGTNGCLYSLKNTGEGETTNPAMGYDNIDAGCRLSFWIGILIVLNVFLVLFALWQFPEEKVSYTNPQAGTESQESQAMVAPMNITSASTA